MGATLGAFFTAFTRDNLYFVEAPISVCTWLFTEH